MKEFLSKVGFASDLLEHRNLWIVKHFFGYKYYGHREINSLRNQIHRISKGWVININAIHVGDKFDIDEKKAIDATIEAARKIMAEHGLSIHIVRHSKISKNSLEDKNADAILDSEGKAVITKYRHGWRVATRFSDYRDGLDTFYVHDITFAAGFTTAIHGPCTKHLRIGDGIFVKLQNYISEIRENAVTLFHEIGHYAGLNHRADPENLMCGGVFNGVNCERNRNELTDYQLFVIVTHCFFYKFNI